MSFDSRGSAAIDFDLMAYNVEVQEGEEARVAYSAVPAMLNDLTCCAWSECSEDDGATAAVLGLDLWSPAWEAGRTDDALAPMF